MARPVHFEILANDPEKMAEFYRKTLGWKIATWNDPQAYWLVTTGPDDTPGINGGIMERHFQQAVINTVQVESLEQMIASIEVAGGKKVFGPHEIQGVGTHAYCADPEGNMFGILQPTAK
ncbi:MAG: VOC family protein [Acidobacteriia bacterium]|nr:VOC family protein [Terriglobia bacterium]